MPSNIPTSQHPNIPIPHPLADVFPARFSRAPFLAAGGETPDRPESRSSQEEREEEPRACYEPRRFGPSRDWQVGKNRSSRSGKVEKAMNVKAGRAISVVWSVFSCFSRPTYEVRYGEVVSGG